MISPFENLLQELSPLIGMNLHVDNHGACCLQLSTGLLIHMEPDKKNNVAIIAFLDELPPGKFRENVLKEGLKANSLLLPGGIIGFCGPKNQFTCHQLLNRDTLTAQDLIEALALIIDYASQWKIALHEGNPAPSFLITKPSTPSPFGMKL